MAQPLSMAAEQFGVEESELVQFREGLPVEDQQALDDLFASTQAYHMAVKYAAAGQPIDLLLITLLLEQHKRIRYLFDQLSYYQQKYYQRSQ
ncbi:MAG TPA: hypothetical protein VF806_07980 [Anaerolineaceae bacterium]